MTFEVLPILPVTAVAPMEIFELSLVPIKVARVVPVVWRDETLVEQEGGVSFHRYWKAVSSPGYDRPKLFLLDIAGINQGMPQFKVLKHLLKRRTVWLDMGCATAPEAMDALMEGVESVVVGSKNVLAMEEYDELFELTEACTPSIDWDGGLITGATSMDKVDLDAFIGTLDEIGLRRLVLLDLPGLGTGRGFDRQLVERLVGDGYEVYVGGGVTESHLKELADMGARGALIDPFTPTIRAIVDGIRDPAIGPDGKVVREPRPAGKG